MASALEPALALLCSGSVCHFPLLSRAGVVGVRRDGCIDSGRLPPL